MHYHPEATLARFRHEQIKPAVARHPFDVLVSIMQLRQHQPARRLWLEGEAGDEALLARATPTSSAFERYCCCSPRAAAAPRANLAALARRLGAPVEPERIDRAVATNTLVTLRTRPNDVLANFWRGEPDVWRRLVPDPIATHLAEMPWLDQPPYGHYRCQAHSALTVEQAEANWKAWTS